MADEIAASRELPERLRRRLRTGESVYFSSIPRFRTKRSPEGRWLAKVRRTERGKLVSFPVKSFSKPEDAVSYAENTRPENRKAADSTKVLVKSGEMTVGQLFDYARKHSWKRLSQSRIEEKERRWRLHLAEEWSSWPLSTVRFRAVQEWLSDQEARVERNGGRGLAQLHECRTDMLGIFKVAIKNEFYEYANPFEELDFVPRRERSRTTIESQHFRHVFAAMEILRDHGLVMPWIVEMFSVGLLAGLREGELLGLRGERISLSNRSIRVDRALRDKAQDVGDDDLPYGPVKRLALGYPKGYDAKLARERGFRHVPISDQLAEVLEVMAIPKMGLVWPNEKGWLREPNRFHTAWYTLRNRMNELAEGRETRWKARNEAVGICNERGIDVPDVWEEIEFRDTRNSYASYATEVGMPEPTRMALMGHVGATVTFRNYTDMTDKAFVDARERLSGGW